MLYIQQFHTNGEDALLYTHTTTVSTIHQQNTMSPHVVMIMLLFISLPQTCSHMVCRDMGPQPMDNPQT